jgi:hypothetical protein
MHLVSRGSSFTAAVPISTSLLKKPLQHDNRPSNVEPYIGNNQEITILYITWMTYMIQAHSIRNTYMQTQCGNSSILQTQLYYCPALVA